MESITLRPIGVIRSVFKEKFGIPRQPGLVDEARATLEILPPYNRPEAFRGLEAFSHVWIVFVFHECVREAWKPTVRPPRLGGNQRLGVFATRSTFRPNPIGLSPVRLERIEHAGEAVRLHLSGVDLLDGTPVLDIKPYLPYADAIAEARGGFAEDAPAAKLTVAFTPAAREKCAALETAYPGLQLLIEQVLAADPRPAYSGAGQGERVYGIKLLDFDLRFKIEGATAVVLDLVQG
ncbi:MAG: tRNA (N6-threonylcarbamoyladenosine(37)-N6)-methyltransferase TrmO [Pseudomonadota bacterium]